MTPNRPRLFSPTKTWGRCVCTIPFFDRDSHIPTVTFPSRVRNFLLFSPTSQPKALYSLEKYVTFSQVCLSPTSLPRVLIMLCRHFYTVRMFLHTMTISYILATTGLIVNQDVQHVFELTRVTFALLTSVY